jgi:hypothetical protein
VDVKACGANTFISACPILNGTTARLWPRKPNDLSSIPGIAENGFALHSVKNGSGANMASCPMDTVPYFFCLKRPEREADHSDQRSPEINNVWSYTSTSPMRLNNVKLTMCRNKNVLQIL